MASTIRNGFILKEYKRRGAPFSVGCVFLCVSICRGGSFFFSGIFAAKERTGTQEAL